MKSVNSTDSNMTLSSPISLYYCGYEQCRPFHSFGPAIRPHYLIHFIIKGEGTFYVDGKAYHLHEKQGFLIKPGVTTFYQADEHNPWEYCWIGFDGYEAQTILENCGFIKTNLIYTDISDGELFISLSKLIDTFQSGSGNEYTYLGQLYLCFSYMCIEPQISTDLFYKNYLQKALDYIHHNYSYDIKIADGAKYIGIDRTYLYKLFITYKKISPQQYLINYRLNIAENLLKETDLSVTEIAYSCGFKDASSFNKHFKRRLSITPSQYRTNKEHYSVNR